MSWPWKVQHKHYNNEATITIINTQTILLYSFLWFQHNTKTLVYNNDFFLFYAFLPNFPYHPWSSRIKIIFVTLLSIING